MYCKYTLQSASEEKNKLKSRAHITYIGIKDFTNEKRPQINFCPQKVSKYLSMWYN